MSLNRIWLVLVVSIFTVLFAAVFVLSRPVFYAGEKEHSHAGMNFTGLIGEQNFGGGFTLLNQDGERVSSSVYKDHYKLIYFGFTYCPEVCPLTLKKMARAIDLLPEDKGAKILPVLISVDPERDTPAVIKSYISMFHPRFIAFTGETGEVEDVLARYRVFAKKVHSEAATEYQMDHTSFIYLTGPDDEVIGVFMTTHSPPEIAESLADVLG